jgi:hypothetical protein
MSYQKLIARAQELREVIAKLDEQIAACDEQPCSASYWAGLCAERDDLEQELDEVEDKIYSMVGC